VLRVKAGARETPVCPRTSFPQVERRLHKHQHKTCVNPRVLLCAPCHDQVLRVNAGAPAPRVLPFPSVTLVTLEPFSRRPFTFDSCLGEAALFAARATPGSLTSRGERPASAYEGRGETCPVCTGEGTRRGAPSARGRASSKTPLSAMSLGLEWTSVRKCTSVRSGRERRN